MIRRRRPLVLATLLVALACDSSAGVEPPPSAGAAKADPPPADEIDDTAKPAEAEPEGEPETEPAEPETEPAQAEAEPAAPTSGWACTCLQEKVKGKAQDVTLCRRDFGDCGKLQRRGGTGSKTIVRNSVAEGKGCRFVGEAEHPGALLGGVEGWEPSAKDGAFSRPGACVLADDPASTLPLEYAIGPLRQGMTAAEVEALLGPPEKQGQIWVEGATGDWVQDWDYASKGVKLGMSAASKRGAQSVSTITVTKPCAYKTNLGVGVGDDFERAKGLYARFAAPPEEQLGPKGFVAGSVYGGVFFDAGDDGSIVSIFIGAGAE